MARNAEVAETLDSHISKTENRAESLYTAAEEVLQNAMEAGNAAAVLASVKTACAVLQQARSLMELRGASGNAVIETPEIEAELERIMARRDAQVREQIRAEVLAEIAVAKQPMVQ